MSSIDIDKDRIFDDWNDNRQRILRESRGTMLCNNCGAEVVKIICCCGPNCRFVGCVHCMTYEERYADYFCGDTCLMNAIELDLNDLSKRLDEKTPKE